MYLSQDALDYVLSAKDELMDLERTLCAIPSPSHQEHRRAAFCKDWLEKAGCTADMSSADICEALVAQMTQISYSGLTGKDMTWNAEGQVSKAPTAYVIKGGEYVLPEA